MLKYKAVGIDAYELRDEFDAPAVKLTSLTDGDGTLRVTAAVTGNMARDIIAGLRLLEVVRASATTPAPSWGTSSPPLAPRS